MPSLIQCPRCGICLSVNGTAANQKFRCPNCTNVFLVRNPEAITHPAMTGTVQPSQIVPSVLPAAPGAKETPSPRPQRRRDGGKGGGGSTVLLLLGVGGVAFLLCGGVLAAALGWFLFRSEPKTPSPVALTPQPVGEKQAPQPVPAAPVVPPPDPGEPPGGRRRIDPAPRPPVLRLPDATEKPRLVLNPGGHSGAVWGVFFTPDGRRVVTASADKTARVFDVQTGDIVRVFRLPVGPGREGALLAGALSPDGKRLAVGGIPFGNGAHGILVYLLSLETGDIERVLKGHSKTVTCLAFSADGKHLATGSLDATVRVHEADSGRLVKVLDGHKDALRCLAFAPRGGHLAALSKKGVRIWSWPEGVPKADLAERTGAFLGASWSPDGDTLATSTDRNLLYLWKADGTLSNSHPVLPDEELQVTSIAYTPDGKGLLYTGVGRTGRAGIFDLQTQRAQGFNEHSNTVLTGSVSADGRLAVTSGGNDHGAPRGASVEWTNGESQ